MRNYTRGFDGWVAKKKEYYCQKFLPSLFKEMDIWWISIGVSVGYEKNEKHDEFLRPVPGLKKFIRELSPGIPRSTKTKDNHCYIQVTVKNKKMRDKLAELGKSDFYKIKNEVVKIITFSLSPKQGSRG